IKQIIALYKDLNTIKQKLNLIKSSVNEDNI
ncbi:MAG: hypothetical protein RIT10_1117, partial [Bacteroidota bacterium]